MEVHLEDCINRGLIFRLSFIEVPALSEEFANPELCFSGTFPISEPPKHQLCKHHWSCKAYSLVGFMKSFSLGFLIRTALIIVPLLLTPKKLLKKPSILLNKNIVKLGLFLGLMSGGSRAIECSLRAIRSKEDGYNQLIAGFVAGFSFLLNGSVEIAMYVASKAAESVYYHLVNKGWPISLPHGEVVAFSLACGIMYNISLYEPHNLRPSYLKFLTRASAGKYAKIVKAFAPIREEYGIPNIVEYQKWGERVKEFFAKY